MIHGINIIICLDRLINKLNFGFPTAWKYTDEIIWNPMIGNIIVFILNPNEAISNNAFSLVKINIKYFDIKINVITVDIKSDVGAANQIPVKPNNLDITMIHGINIIICLDRLINKLNFGFPTAWKYTDEIIWNPMIGNIIVFILNPNEAISNNAFSLVKINIKYFDKRTLLYLFSIQMKLYLTMLFLL